VTCRTGARPGARHVRSAAITAEQAHARCSAGSAVDKGEDKTTAWVVSPNGALRVAHRDDRSESADRVETLPIGLREGDLVVIAIAVS